MRAVLPLAKLPALGPDRELRRFLLFLAVGAINTLVGYALFALFSLLGAHPTAAVVGATVLGALFNFKSIGTIVFGNAAGRRLPRFVAIYAVQCGMNIAGLHALGAAGLAPLPAEAILLPPLAVATYLAMRRFVFGHSGT